MAGVTIKLQGAKEIEKLFAEVPKQIKEYNLWKALWRKIGKPALQEAKNLAPQLGDSRNVSSKIKREGIPYPPQKSLTIKKGTLKNSIGFFTTRDSKNHLGIYLGPRVKRRYGKNKGGYYGAWVEYGNEVMFFGKARGKSQKFMNPAWKNNRIKMTTSALTEAEVIAAKAIKRHANRLKKYGRAGY
jgi:hypothetical protein